MPESRQDTPLGAFSKTEKLRDTPQNILRGTPLAVRRLTAIPAVVTGAAGSRGARQRGRRFGKRIRARPRVREPGPAHGYVIDHRVPLKRGGRDHASNMQWQTREAARAKDRME